MFWSLTTAQTRKSIKHIITTIIFYSVNISLLFIYFTFGFVLEVNWASDVSLQYVFSHIIYHNINCLVSHTGLPDPHGLATLKPQYLGRYFVLFHLYKTVLLTCVPIVSSVCSSYTHMSIRFSCVRLVLGAGCMRLRSLEATYTGGSASVPAGLCLSLPRDNECAHASMLHNPPLPPSASPSLRSRECRRTKDNLEILFLFP